MDTGSFINAITGPMKSTTLWNYSFLTYDPEKCWECNAPLDDYCCVHFGYVSSPGIMGLLGNFNINSERNSTLLVESTYIIGWSGFGHPP